ncbi:MAG: type I DNA topoisomerase [Acidobacteriota bacterium]|nr:type I DNA topoisomerase [Acidobacteriota bacterium]
MATGKSLVIVESPAKAKTIEKYLGKGFEVLASVGHIMDLPKNDIGVELKKRTFEPTLIVSPGKEKVVAQLKKAAAKADEIYLAPDPDREGEAIAYHLAMQLGTSAKDKKKIHRVTFNEITKKAVQDAFQHARDVDQNLVYAQQTRRVLDRLVGYQISPLLWDKVRRGLSAGRVQTVAVRLIVEREREIGAFKPVEYWTIDAVLQTPKTGVQTSQPEYFTARFVGIDGERASVETVSAPAVPNETIAREIVEASTKAQWVVRGVEKKERKKSSPAPFTTSSLQQQAAAKLGFNVRRTMGVAQRLYEGIDLGAEGTTGLITYMRTDSTRVAPDAIAAAREFIGKEFGASYLPAQPNTFKSKKDAQDAHEAIRPTDPSRHPDRVKQYLTSEQLKLYRLVWQRFIASQMMPALFDVTTVDIDAVNGKRYNFRISGSQVKFDGYRRLYQVEDEEDVILPEIPNGSKLSLATPEQLRKLAEIDRNEKLERARRKYATDIAKIEARNERAEEGGELEPIPSFEEPKIELAMRPGAVDTVQKFTEPPPRFNEASLVKTLEEKGIGRPSTYASIINTIQDREYVTKIAGRFYPTEIGMVVCDLLVKNFPYIFDVAYTARLEEELDDIEDGKEQWTDLLKGFYGYFEEELIDASKNMENIKRMETMTDEKCEVCGSPLVLKWGKFGSFYSCSNFSKKKPMAVAVGPWKKDSDAVVKKVTGELNFPMTVRAKVDDSDVFSREVKNVRELSAAIDDAVVDAAAKGKKISVEQWSCDFTKENFAAKPDLNTPEGQEAGEQEEYCDNCGRVMVLKRGIFGPYMACPGFNDDPPCKTIRKLSSKQQQKQNAPQPTGENCPVCGKALVLRQGAYGEFVSCSGYPKCKYIKQNLIEGLKCPKCGVGDIAERKARRGNVFWGCTNYPKCDFTSNYKPVAQQCPECKSPYLVEKVLKSGIYLECPNKKKSAEEEAAAAKKRAKKGAPASEEKATVVCSYSKRIGDAPPPPTAETHGPVVEKDELQPV